MCIVVNGLCLSFFIILSQWITALPKICVEKSKFESQTKSIYQFHKFPVTYGNEAIVASFV